MSYHCDGCGTEFDICHALDCKKGGLITACHNKLRYGVANLASKAFTPTYVRNNPKIYTGRTVREGEYKLKGSPSKDEEDLKGYPLIIDLWMQGTDRIHDMRVVNTYVASYQFITPEKCLETSEKENKKKYLDACLKHCPNFTPFVASVDGLLGVEEKATLKRITRRLATKWKEPYPCTMWLCED